MYNNNIVNFQESTTTLNAYTKKSGTLLNAPRIYIYIYIYIVINRQLLLVIHIFQSFYIFLSCLHIHRQLNITNITPHSPDDGLVEPKRYSVDFVSQ